MGYGVKQIQPLEISLVISLCMGRDRHFCTSGGKSDVSIGFGGQFV